MKSKIILTSLTLALIMLTACGNSDNSPSESSDISLNYTSSVSEKSTPDTAGNHSDNSGKSNSDNSGDNNSNNSGNSDSHSDNSSKNNSDNFGNSNSHSDNSGKSNSDNLGNSNSHSDNSGKNNSDNSGDNNSHLNNSGKNNSDNSGNNNSHSDNSSKNNSDNSGNNNSHSDNSGNNNSKNNTSEIEYITTYTESEIPNNENKSGENSQIISEIESDTPPEESAEGEEEIGGEAVHELGISLESTTLSAGETVAPTITVPEELNGKSLTLESSDGEVISVNNDFTITAEGAGECTVTVRADDGKGTSASITVTVKALGTYFDGILLVNKEYSIPKEYNPNGLTSETAAAFDSLVQAAAQSGYTLYSLSDFRPYEEQESLYASYVTMYGQAGADALCSKPGHSEHQTGMAIDVASARTGYFPGTPEAAWLAEHCSEFGFIIRYPYGKESFTGYGYEPWHIRYIGDKAQEITDSGLSLEEWVAAAYRR